MKKYLASAPSNIAIIKYMGKTDSLQNNPTNASLSLTLDSLKTFVELQPQLSVSAEVMNARDSWQSFEPKAVPEKLVTLELSEKSQERFLKHLSFLKKTFGIETSFLVKSGNNFPSDCGLASSASSFAALTLAFKKYLEDSPEKFEMKLDDKKMKQEDWAQLSRKGSGSSCRSFLGPWVEWREDGSILAHEFQMEPLLHSVVIVEAGKKQVSSSEAHRRVVSSPHFIGRADRAHRRLVELLELWKTSPGADDSRIWDRSFEIVWDEFMDMHQLFETCETPFKYMNSETYRILQYLENFWRQESSGPLVTMDAGANVHLIFKKSQSWMRSKIERDLPQIAFFHSEMTH